MATLLRLLGLCLLVCGLCQLAVAWQGIPPFQEMPYQEALAQIRAQRQAKEAPRPKAPAKRVPASPPSVDNSKLASEVARLSSAVEALNRSLAGGTPKTPSEPRREDPQDPPAEMPAAVYKILSEACAECHTLPKVSGGFALFAANDKALPLPAQAMLVIDQVIYSGAMHDDLPPMPAEDYSLVRGWISNHSEGILRYLKGDR